MFESLKKKLKNVFKKGGEALDEKQVYEEQPEKPAVPVTEKPAEVPREPVQEKPLPAPEPEAPAGKAPVEVPEEPVPEPVQTEVPAPKVPETPVREEPRHVPRPAVSVKKTPAEVPKAPAPEPVQAETVRPAEPPKPLSKKERKEAAKAKGKSRVDSMLSDGFLSKKIKDDPLDDVLDELEVTLLESDVAYDVVQEIILGTR